MGETGAPGRGGRIGREIGIAGGMTSRGKAAATKNPMVALRT